MSLNSFHNLLVWVLFVFTGYTPLDGQAQGPCGDGPFGTAALRVWQTLLIIPATSPEFLKLLLELKEKVILT